MLSSRWASTRPSLYHPWSYGDALAPVYDRLYPEAETGCLKFLSALAGSGPVLELGIGTGRLALPLARQGLEVHGLEVSERMRERLTEKLDGESVVLHAVDFREFRLPYQFSLAFVAFSTFFALLEQAHQVSCMASVAAHLRSGGHFVLESFLPDPGRFDRGQRVSTYAVLEDGVMVDYSLHDVLHQRVSARMVLLGKGGVEAFPAELRYVWPAELDLMAQLTGFELVERYADWERRTLQASSKKYLSVYRKL